MNETFDKYENDIKPLKWLFLSITALVLILSTTLVIQKRKQRVLTKANSELARANEGMNRVKEGSLQRKQALMTLKSQLILDVENTASPEKRIYGKIDEIMARFKPNDMTIKALEKKGGDVSLQYTLKFTNPDYSGMLNTISLLQQAVFPFTPVNTITISQAEQNGKGVVEFTIDGSVLTQEKTKP